MAPASMTRLVPVRVLTPLGWIPCAFDIPRLSTFPDWLDHQGPFLRPSSARIPGRNGHVSTFVLQRDAAILILPDDPADAVRVEPIAADRVEHEVAFMMEVGVIRGRLGTIANVSIADWMMHRGGFVELVDAAMSLVGSPVGEEIPRQPCVLVNASRVIGVVESAGARGSGRPLKALPGPVGKAPKKA